MVQDCGLLRVLGEPTRPSGGRRPKAPDPSAVRVLNPSSKVVTLYRGKPIASLQQVEEASGLSVSAAQLQSESSQDKDAMLWEMVEATGEALDSEEREQLYCLLTEYADIFAINKDLGRTDKVQHQIVTGDSAPIRQQVPAPTH